MSDDESSHPAATRCHVCGGECRFAFEKDGFDIVRCGACDFRFVHPYPSEADLNAYYAMSYRGASEDSYPKARSRARRAFVKSFRFLRYLRGKTALDIGCGGGFTVNAFRRLGADAHGLDISQNSIAYARRHYPINTFVHGTIEGFAAEPEASRFDLVYCSEVIEHIPDVQAFAAAVAGLLRPGGVFFVTTPDISHWRRPRDLLAWDAFCPPSHCIYFNPGSLRLLMERHELQVVRRRFAFKPGIKLVCRKNRGA